MNTVAHLPFPFSPLQSSSYPFSLSPFPSLPPPSVMHVVFLPHFCLYPSPHPFPRSVCIPFVKKLDGKINFLLGQPAKRVNPLVTLWMQTQIFELTLGLHTFTYALKEFITLNSCGRIYITCDITVSNTVILYKYRTLCGIYEQQISTDNVHRASYKPSKETQLSSTSRANTVFHIIQCYICNFT